MVLESTSFWFKRAIDSLRSAGAVEEGSPGIGPLGFITPDYAEFAVSALKYSYIKKTEEEATPPPPRKKKALLVPSKSKMKLQCQKRSTDHCSKPDCKIQCICCADPRRKRKVPERFSEFHLMDKGGDSPPSKKVGKKFAHRGALTNKFGAVGGAFEMEKFLEDEQFLRLELPKLVEEEKARASDDDIDLTIRTSRGGHRKIQLVAWIRIRSLYRSGKIHIRVRSRNRSSAPIPLV